jgi:hypothetical protein
MNLLIRQVNGIKFLCELTKEIFCITVGMKMRSGSGEDVRAVLGEGTEESFDGISASGEVKGEGFEILNGSEVLILLEIFNIRLLD